MNIIGSYLKKKHSDSMCENMFVLNIAPLDVALTIYANVCGVVLLCSLSVVVTIFVIVRYR